MWRQAGRAIATRSGLLMSGEKSMPTRKLLHLGADVAVVVVVRVVDLKRGDRSVLGGGRPGASGRGR